MSPPRPLVLASTSPYRRALLERLRIPFSVARPDVVEERLPDESPAHMVQRLAEAKARAVQKRHPEALIIGSDQCAAVEDVVLGKPGDPQRAAAQLARLSGQRVVFHTGLCLLDHRPAPLWSVVVPYVVEFRELTPTEIERYLHAEQPYDCAGSFKSEGLGVTLFRRLEGTDPTALIGLPLIELCHGLRAAGHALP